MDSLKTAALDLDLDPAVLADFRRLFAASRALVVEDEIGPAIADSLRQAGFASVDVAETAEGALRSLADDAYDVVILDRRMPGADGMDLLTRIRDRESGLRTRADAPVLVFSMLDEGRERLKGLIAGADDYVSKSASNEELLARIAVRYRVAGRGADDGWTFAPLQVEEQARVVTLDGAPLRLTSREAHILCELHAERGRPLSKSMLWERCWIGAGWTYFPEQYENIVDQAIRRLRHRLEDQCGRIPAPYHPLLVNIWSQGFALRNLAGLERADGL